MADSAHLERSDNCLSHGFPKLCFSCWAKHCFSERLLPAGRAKGEAGEGGGRKASLSGSLGAFPSPGDRVTGKPAATNYHEPGWEASHSPHGCGLPPGCWDLHPLLASRERGAQACSAGCDPKFLSSLFHYLGAQSICQMNSVSLAGYYALN